jgi:hypothetical protein
MYSNLEQASTYFPSAYFAIMYTWLAWCTFTADMNLVLKRWSHYVNYYSVHTDWMIGCSSPGRGWEFFSSSESRQALGPTQPPIQWVTGVSPLGVKRPGRETDHSPPSSAEVNNSWSCTSTPQYAFMAWCSVKKARGKLCLILSLNIHYIEYYFKTSAAYLNYI